VINYALLGQRIRVIRQQNGITQEVLAEPANISIPFMSYIECSKKKPSLEVLLRIAIALDTTPDALLMASQLSEFPDQDIKKLLASCSPKERDFITQLIRFVIMHYLDR